MFSPTADCTGFPLHSGSVTRAGSAVLDSRKEPLVSDWVVLSDVCLNFRVRHSRRPYEKRESQKLFFPLFAVVRSWRLQVVAFRHFEQGGNRRPLVNVCRFPQQRDSYNPESAAFSPVDGISFPLSEQIPDAGFLCAFLEVRFLANHSEVVFRVAASPGMGPYVVNVMLFRVVLFAFQIAGDNRPFDLG